jgi:hypothetical protein
MKIILYDNTKKQLIDLYNNQNIHIEGNILKLIDTSNDVEFEEYINKFIENDKDMRRKRLVITKRVQQQNNELLKAKDEYERIQTELSQSLIKTQESAIEAEKLRKEAENAKIEAENDLDILQKKKQNELIGKIVVVALWIIIGVGIVTTGVYLFSIFSGIDTQLIASTWSNIIGILLTNAFSIIGTIMGVKYASEMKK